MTGDYVREFSGGVFEAVLAASVPALLGGCIVALSMKLLRAATQTPHITFVDASKIAAAAFCLFILFPWFARLLVTLTTNIILNAPIHLC